MEYFQLFLDNAKEFIATIDTNYCFLLFSTSFKDQFKAAFNSEIYVGGCLLDFLRVFPQERITLKALWSRALNGESFTEINNFGRHNEYYEIRYTPLRNKDGEILGASCISLPITEVEKTNRELHFKESKIMQSVINNTQDIIVAVDLQYRIIAFNRSYKEELKNTWGCDIRKGMTLNEALSCHPRGADVASKGIALFDRALKGETYSIIEQFGGTEYYLIRFCPIYNESGVLIGASHIATNYNQQMNMQEEIKRLNEQLTQKLQVATKTVIESNQNINKLQEKLELVLDAAGIGVWTWDVKQNHMRSDKKNVDLYKLPSSDTVRVVDHILATVVSEDRDRVQQELEKFKLDLNHFMNAEFRIQWPDSSIRWISATGKMYLDEHGEPEEIVVMNWDITHKINLQNEKLEALRIQKEKTEYFGKLAESVDLIVWIVNDIGNIEYCNQRCYEYTGLEPASPSNWNWKEVLHKDDNEEFNKQWKEAVNTGNKCEVEFRLKHSADSTYRWHLGKISPFYNSDGKIMKWFGTGTDIHDLKTAQESLSLILKTANIGLWNWDLVGGHCEIDDRSMELLDFKKKGFHNTAEEFFNQVNPEDLPPIHASVEKCIKAESSFDAEFRILTTDGSLRWIGSRGEAQFDAHGTPIRLMGMNIDVTKKKLLEAQHLETVKKGQENQELLNQLLENLPVGVWTTDAYGNSDYVNKYWTDRTGIKVPMTDESEEVCSVIHPDYRKENSRRWKHSLAHGTAYSIEFLIKTHGSYHWYVSKAYPMRDANGKITRWLGTSIDIHDLKETIKELEFQINLTKTITDNTASALFMIDEKGYPTFMNPAAERITGYKLEEIHSKRLHCLLNPASNIVEAAREVQNKQDIFVSKEGRLFPVIRSTSHLFRNGKTIGAVVEFRDVTLEKQAEQEKLAALKGAELLQKKRAEEAENNKKRQEEFINTICHEVRNPLNGLIGISSLLSDELKELNSITSSICAKLEERDVNRINTFFVRVNEYIRTLEVCSEQQKVIVDDVLDLSKLENNKIQLNFSAFDIKYLISNTMQIFVGKLTEKKLQYRVNYSMPDIFIQGDMYRLSQILINLLSNAIKFTKVGEIVIDVNVVYESSQNYTISFVVQDTGIGMTQTEVNHLFNSFYQANLKNSYGGTGLGLVITKKLVELMGGKISVTSEKWKGSKFTVTIQFNKATMQECTKLPTPPTQVSSNAHEKLVLVVEDNVINQKILCNYLEQKGYNYHIAINGLQAIEKCKIYNFNVILMDIEMPLMNGLEATIQIRNDSLNSNCITPIVGLSGNSMRQQIEEALSCGMNDYLTKPFHKEDVYKIIDKFSAIRTVVQNQ